MLVINSFGITNWFLLYLYHINNSVKLKIHRVSLVTAEEENQFFFKHSFLLFSLCVLLAKWRIHLSISH